MITQDDMEASFHWIFDNARNIAQARGRMVYTERQAERMKAVMMKKFPDLPISGQEREAKASDELKLAYEKEARAAEEYEYFRTMRDAHIARIEAWRTLESTARAFAKTAEPREAPSGPQPRER